MVARPLALVALIAVMSFPAAAAEIVQLHAAGSLREALDDIIGAFTAASGDRVEAKYGASGTLKDEIAGGARTEIFASANMAHPEALARMKRAK